MRVVQVLAIVSVFFVIINNVGSLNIKRDSNRSGLPTRYPGILHLNVAPKAVKPGVSMVIACNGGSLVSVRKSALDWLNDQGGGRDSSGRLEF